VGVLWLEAEAREGTAGAASERDKKHGAREKFWPAVGGSTLLKGGRQDTIEGAAKSRAMRGGGGALAPIGRDSSGGVARPAAARPRRACPHSGGRCRVTDEQGPDGSGRVLGREARACVGRPGKEMEWGRARMNSADFYLFKPISNELGWF
jgi:hypothetical protein